MKNPSITSGASLLHKMEEVFSRHRSASAPLSVLAVDASAGGDDHLLIPALMGLLGAQSPESYHAFADGMGFRAFIPGVDENEARRICQAFVDDVNERLPASHQFDIAIGLAKPNPNASLETLFRVAWEGARVARYRRGSSVVHTMVYRSVQGSVDRHDEAAWMSAPELLAIEPGWIADEIDPASEETQEVAAVPEPGPHELESHEPAAEHTHEPLTEPTVAESAPAIEVSPDESFSDDLDDACDDAAPVEEAIEVALEERHEDDAFELPEEEEFDLSLEELQDDDLAAILPEEEIAERTVYMQVAVESFVEEKAFEEALSNELQLDPAPAVTPTAEVEELEDEPDLAPLFDETDEEATLEAHEPELVAIDEHEEPVELEIADEIEVECAADIEAEQVEVEHLEAEAVEVDPIEAEHVEAEAEIHDHTADETLLEETLQAAVEECAPAPVEQELVAVAAETQNPEPVATTQEPAPETSAPQRASRSQSYGSSDLFDQLCYGYGDDAHNGR